MARVLAIKNWQRFQHYKDRDPPWVKLYRDALTSEAWVLGTDLSRLLQVASTLLAARYQNATPLDAKLIRRVLNLDCSDAELMAAIDHLAAHEFFEIQELNPTRKQDASNMLATCTSEAEAETEAETEKNTERAREKTRPPPVPRGTLRLLDKIQATYPAGTFRQADWILAEREIRRLLDDGEKPDDLVAAAAAYALQQQAKGSTGTQFVLNPAKFYGSAGIWRGPFPMPKADTKPRENTDALRAWDALIATDGAQRDERVQFALDAVGGWMAVRQRTQFDEAKLRAAFCRAYAGEAAA